MWLLHTCTSKLCFTHFIYQIIYDKGLQYIQLNSFNCISKTF